MEKAQVLFLNAGTGLGKSLQQFVKGAEIGEGMQEVMELIESDGKAVPAHLAKEIIEMEPEGHQFSEIGERPIGTGTVAETRKATLTYRPNPATATEITEPVAVRYLKPGIENRASQDMLILSSFLDKVTRQRLLPEAMLPNLRKTR